MQEILPPGEYDPRDKLKQLEQLADLMDNKFTLPGTQVRLGLDALLGLIPVLGDTISLAVSATIFQSAHDMGVPKHVKWRMGGNIFMDWLIGLVPLIGDAFDIGWKANRRNVALLKKHLSKQTTL